MSFLNENKTLILKEEICSLNQDLLTILEDKETKFGIYIGKTSPTLIKHDQDILLRGSIPKSHFSDGPCVSFKPLPICNEQDNLSSSYFLVKDIDLILGEEVNEHLKSNANTQIEENFSFKEHSLSTDTFNFISSSTYFSLYPNLFNNYNSQDNFSLEFHPDAQNFDGFPDDKLCFRD